MNRKFALVLYLQVVSVFSAPTQLQLMPMQYGFPQLPFWRQNLPNVQTLPIYPQQPLVIVIPNGAPNSEGNVQETNSLKTNTGVIDESKEALVVDAEKQTQPIDAQTKNALVYLPSEGRFAIGSIISLIPFLPVEVNVPETISWIANVIGGWIRPQNGGASVKRVSNKGPAPLLVMPFPGSVQQ